MITPDAGQQMLATKSSVRSVTLVRVRCWSNRLTNTFGTTYYWATLPVRYQWTAGTTTQFEGRVKQVSAFVRGFSHIPDGVTTGVRDGISITLDLSLEGTVWPWATLGNEFLHGALVDVATVLVDEAQFTAADPFDLSALGAVHVVRWRGEITSTTDYDWERGTVALNCDTIEPTLSWPTARDPLTNEPRDVGKRYPIPVGFLARSIELVGLLVGHATTLAGDVAASGTAAWSITDGEGFPTAGSFTVKAGDEFVTAFGPTSTPTSLSISARAQLGSTAQQHARGSTILEYVREIRFVASAREIQRVAQLYWQTPSGQRVRLEPGSYGVNVAAAEVEAGQVLAVVSMARSEITAALAAVAAVLQQPELSASGVAIAKLAFSSWSGTSGTTASVGPAVHSVDSYVNVDSPAGVRVDYTGAASDRVAIMWATVAEQPTANVRRIRPVFDLRIDSVSPNATVVKWEMDSHGLGGRFLFNSFNEVLVTQGGTATVRTQVAGSWQTPVNPLTVEELLGIDVGANGDTHGFHVCIFLNNTTGTAGDGFFIYTDSSYLEVEIDPPSILTNVPVDVAAGWSVGDGLKLIADCGGIVSRANEAAVTALDFSTTTGWTAVNCTISVQTIGGRSGIRLASPTNAATVDLVKTGLSLNWSAAGASISFEVYCTAAFKDKLTATGGRFVELKVGTNATDMYAYPFSPGDLIDDTWTTLTADLVWHPSRVKLGAGATLSNITRIELGPAWDSTTGAPQIHFRNVRYMERTLIDHPIDVAAFVIEDLAGLTAAVDSAYAADAKANLPSCLFSGDLRNAGDGFVPILARLGFEGRTNWVPVEGAAGTLYRPFAAIPAGFSGANYSFEAPLRTLTTFRRLQTATRQLDEIATQFSALWDYRPEPNGSQVEAYRKASRCDEVVNDIVARISSGQLSTANQSVGLRESLPQEFRLVNDAATLLDVWAFYVAEALRFGGANARRFSMVVDYADGYDLEPGDVVQFAAPWGGSSIKCRVTRVAFAPDAPGVGLSLEQVV